MSAPKKHAVPVGDAQETLLIPLYGRAVLTREGSPLIHDPWAVDMVDALDYDFARFEGLPSLVGATWRTRVFDSWAKDWLERHPDGTVIEIGVGLNTRFERLDNGRARWFELDLPDAMTLRRHFFTDGPRRTSIAASVADPSWVAVVHASPGPYLFIAEAVFGFLTEDQVVAALDLIGSFDGAHLVFDAWTTWMAAHQDTHDALSKVAARVTWFCDDVSALRTERTALRVLESGILPDAPAAVRADLPPSVRDNLHALRADGQVSSYRLYLTAVLRPGDR